MPWWKHVLGVTTILLGCCALYLPALGGGFLWDDDVWLSGSPFTTADDGILRVWHSRGNQDYWPLTSSVFWVQYRLWGDNPDGYRAVNVALHALSAVCLWLILRRLNVPGAWLAAAIFAAHPVAVASVAWIAELKNVLSMFLAMLAVLAWLHYDARRSKLFYGLALAAFVAALAAKTSVAMLPVVLLGVAWWRRGRVLRRDVLPLIPFVAVSAFMAGMTILFQHAQTTAMRRVPEVALLERVGVAARALWFYLAKSVAPLRLNMNYSQWETNALAPAPLAAIFAAVAAAAVLWQGHRGRMRGPAAGLAAFAVMLLPVLGFVNMSFMQFAFVSDHLQYVALPPVAALLGAGIWRLSRWRGRAGRWVALVVAAAGLIALGGLTWRRAGVFRNSTSLWTDTLAKNPGSWLAHNGLGVELNDAGDDEGALRQYEQAVRLNDGYADGLSNLAKSYAERGLVALEEGGVQAARADFARASMTFEKASRLNTLDAGLLHEWGNTLVRLGRLQDAEAVLSQALQIDPNHAGVHLQLGLAAYHGGRMDRAVSHYRRAIELRGDWEKPLINLAWLLLTEKGPWAPDAGEALRLARRGAEVASEDRFRAQVVLAEAEAQAGNFSEARAAAGEAMQLARSQEKPKEAEVARRLVELYGSGSTYIEHAALEAGQSVDEDPPAATGPGQ